MVALAVLLTFLVCIGIDFVLHRQRYRFRVAGAWFGDPSHEVSGVTLPPVLAYHPGHTWALDEKNGNVKIGIDELGVSLLGHITRVEVPKRGRWLQQGDRGFVIETTHGTVALPAPADGEVVAINEEALANPELIEKDPYQNGWLLELRAPGVEVNFRNLLAGSLAKRWMEDSVETIRRAVAPQGVRVLSLADGHLSRRLGSELQLDAWTSLTKQMFRC
jgi:glycine cleavage system H protein